EGDDEIIGTYRLPGKTGPAAVATLRGPADGSNRLEIHWKEYGNSTGNGVFVLSADGKTFRGTWGYGASATDGGAWVGERISDRPDLLMNPDEVWRQPALRRQNGRDESDQSSAANQPPPASAPAP